MILALCAFAAAIVGPPLALIVFCKLMSHAK
jgi:hypothetical protein